MSYEYDIYGWCLGTTEASTRITDVEPPVLEAPLYANWDGYLWVPVDTSEHPFNREVLSLVTRQPISTAINTAIDITSTVSGIALELSIADFPFELKNGEETVTANVSITPIDCRLTVPELTTPGTWLLETHQIEVAPNQFLHFPNFSIDCTTPEVVPEPEPSKPTLVITSITGGLYANNEVTLPAGTTLTASGEIRLDDVLVAALSDSFRMPIKATDGREKVLLATVTNGVASITWTPKESGIWVVSEALMNRDLPSQNHLQFTGLKIFVLE